MDVKLGKRLHIVAHVDSILGGATVLLELVLVCAELLHVKLMDLLTALVVDHVHLATHGRYEQVLAHLLLGHAIDAVDHLSFT